MDHQTVSNQWDAGWRIGTINYIDQSTIKFRAAMTDISDRLLYGNSRHINGLNQYLFSYLDRSVKVVFKVVSIEESEKPYGPDASDKISQQFTFTASALGEILHGEYIPGVIDIPMVGSNIYACDPDELSVLFKSSEAESIGKLSGYDGVFPSIDLDHVFSGHMAILGNTGSGKSTTSRLLIEKLMEKIMDENKPVKKDALFIVFDIHGDYRTVAEQYTSNDNINYLECSDYHLAAGDFDITDWSAILSPSQRIQRPLLERAIAYSRLNEIGKQKLYAAFSYNAIQDTSVDSHAARKFQLLKYMQHIKKQLAEHIDTPVGSVQEIERLLREFSLHYGNITEGVTESLQDALVGYLGEEYMEEELPNIEAILSSTDLQQKTADISLENICNALDFVFSEEEVKGNRQARSYSEGLVTQLFNLKERYANNLFACTNGRCFTEILKERSGILILDVSQVIDADGLRLLSTFMARTLFERNRHAGKLCSDEPVYLIFDEAHRYIREDMLTDDSIFNRIAREGRKFGVNLTVVSQIPSELSRVVLSQTSTFIIHRIQNAIDLDFLRRNVPAISYDQVSRLPSFAPGTAVVLGSSMKLPMELQIDGRFKNDTPPISMYRANDES